GSIGVISLHPMAPALLERLGVKFQVAKGGRLKDMGAFYRESTEEERQKEQALVDEYYEVFVAEVARCRGLEVEQVRPMATGEVFSGRRAKELGLVDELGDLEQALEIAARLAQVSTQYYYLRPRRPFWERILSPMASSMVAGVLEEVESRFPFRLYYM
ncbi:MAG: S49 family peptidase, partial [Chloroflexota bacterium]